MSWDLWGIIILVALSGAVLIVGPLVALITRKIQWYHSKQFTQCYVPHSTSFTPWRQNEWKQKGVKP